MEFLRNETQKHQRGRTVGHSKCILYCTKGLWCTSCGTNLFRGWDLVWKDIALQCTLNLLRSWKLSRDHWNQDKRELLGGIPQGEILNYSPRSMLFRLFHFKLEANQLTRNWTETGWKLWKLRLRISFLGCGCPLRSYTTHHLLRGIFPFHPPLIVRLLSSILGS